MQHKTLSTIKDSELSPEQIKVIQPRFDVVCTLDPVMLLKVCLVMPQGDDAFAKMREHNSVASQNGRMGLFSVVNSYLAELVFPYIDFLMADYDETQVRDVKLALGSFVTFDLAERSEWSDEYIEFVSDIEKALGYN